LESRHAHLLDEYFAEALQVIASFAAFILFYFTCVDGVSWIHLQHRRTPQCIGLYLSAVLLQ